VVEAGDERFLVGAEVRRIVVDPGAQGGHRVFVGRAGEPRAGEHAPHRQAARGE
jgi:hypothetical protein